MVGAIIAQLLKTLMKLITQQRSQMLSRERPVCVFLYVFFVCHFETGTEMVQNMYMQWQIRDHT